MKFRFNYKALITMVLTIVCFYFLIMFVETWLNTNYEDTVNWRNERKDTVYLNVLVVYSLFLVLLGVINRYVISFFLTNLLVLFLAMMSFYKFSFLSENLYPWDLLLYNNVINLLPNIYKEIDMTKLILGVIVAMIVIGIIIIFTRMKKPSRLIRLNLWVRFIFVGLGVAYLSAFIFYRTVPKIEKSLKDVGITNITFNQNKNYEQNGFLVTFLLNMQSAIVVQPKGYSERKITEIIDQLEKVEMMTTEGPRVQPNIIIVMNESFWDPTLMEKVEFSKDPMPNVREHQSGQILSPTFGGGTSNVEFEALTGFSNVFLPTGSVPYQQYIKNSIPALPGYLSELGYKSFALHPYPKWFWNREEVYEHMGFEQFIDIDGLENPIYKGPFVSDHQVTNSIIEMTEDHDEPVFVYAITMQNHTGYAEDKYDKFDIETRTPKGVDEVYNILLRSYTQGVVDADIAFKELIDYYDKSDEPTIVVFFGDHLPAIGHDYRLYKIVDYVPRGAGESQWEVEDFRKTRETPLVLWNNYGAEIPEVETMSPSFLAPAIFDLAGMEKPLYYTLLEQFESVMPGYTKEVKVDSTGKLHSATPAEVKQIEQDYQLIQYDLLFGGQYSRERLFGGK